MEFAETVLLVIVVGSLILILTFGDIYGHEESEEEKKKLLKEIRILQRKKRSL